MKFLATWGNSKAKKEYAQYYVWEDHFMEDNEPTRGYTEEEVKDIMNLKVRQEWIYKGKGRGNKYSHTIKRVK